MPVFGRGVSFYNQALKKFWFRLLAVAGSAAAAVALFSLGCARSLPGFFKRYNLD